MKHASPLLFDSLLNPGDRSLIHGYLWKIRLEPGVKGNASFET